MQVSKGGYNDKKRKGSRHHGENLFISMTLRHRTHLANLPLDACFCFPATDLLATD